MRVKKFGRERPQLISVHSSFLLFFLFVFTPKFGEDCPIPRIVTSRKSDLSIRTDRVMICTVFTSRTLLTLESSIVFTSRKAVVSIHECY